MIDDIVNAANSEHVKTRFILGDLNISMSCDHDRRALDDVLDVYNMKNIITSPTCFKSVDKPTVLDVILTTSNVTRRISEVINTHTGLSDFHHLVGFSTKLQFPRNHRNVVIYRSYKHFYEMSYKQDMANIPYHVGEIFDDIDGRCWFTQKLISSVID